ncbi:MAG: tail fiber domain-containing protein, partial [Flavobacterium sp.]
SANGSQSTVFGRNNIANGTSSNAFGIGNTAISYGETVIGIGATTYTSSANGATQFRTANATDRLFVIGNAIDTNNNTFIDNSERSDAMIVLKNGLTRLPSMDNAMIDVADGKTVVIKEYLEERSSGTLDQAYDFGGPGVGNTIIADAGAVTIAGTDGLVSTGTLGSGVVYPDGDGSSVRLVWNPRKAAFRVGAAVGVDDNIGTYSTAFGAATASGVASFAFGNSTIASGTQSTAFGFSTTASGNTSTAFGSSTTTSGSNSTAFGQQTNASGFASTAFGDISTASGNVSTAFGRQNTASSYSETVIGIGATTYIPSTNGATQFRTANATDRLFVIGNAIDANNNGTVDAAERSDAMVVLKNGNTGIGSSTPQDRLHVVGNIRMVDGNQAAGSIMVSNANGTASWQTVNVPALNGWSTLGNTGLNAATNFIGTTNAVDVIFRRNNIRAGRLGVNNTSFGVNALSQDVTGTFNTAIGSAALQDITNGARNVAVGSVSLNANTSGNENTAVGVDALSFNETGNNNTVVGRRAMGAIGASTTGSNNTAIGYFAYSTGNFTNSTALGANTVITASNQIRLGNNTVTSIGGFAPFTNLSDSRFKKNIQSDVPGLAFINKLKPVTYQLDMESMARFLNTPEASRDRNAERIRENTLETGFIAQEVEQAAREAGFVFSGVDVPQGSGDYYGLRYASFVVPLVKAMQEQQIIIDKIQLENEALKSTLEQVLQRLEKLEK